MILALHPSRATDECPIVRALANIDGALWIIAEHGNSLTTLTSSDEGETWQPIGPYGNQRYLSVSSDGSVIYTSGYGAFASTNGGADWSMITEELEWFGYRDIAQSPLNSQIAFVYTSEPFGGEIFLKTDDGGQVWETFLAPQEHAELFPGTYYGLQERVIQVDPLNHDHILIGAPGLMTKDGGATWHQLPSWVRTFASNALVPEEVLMGMHYGGLYWSPDGGLTVQPRGMGTDFEVLAIAYAPDDPMRAYVLARTGDSTGLYISQDDAVTWSHISSLDSFGAVDFYDERPDYLVGSSSIRRIVQRSIY